MASLELARQQDREAAPEPRRLSERVFLLQQIVPFVLLALVMFYEVTRHLLFANVQHPTLIAIEVLTFGIAGPAALWGILQWIGVEIRAREQAQDQADTRTRMLLEMQHRIKNNLQTVADLLSLELSRSTQPEAAQSLRDSVNRIKTIAAAHELLSTDQVGAIDIVELAQRVAENARLAQVRPGQTLALRVNGDPIRLSSKAATAFALVVNELVSNSLEHGLVDRPDGEIEIAIEEQDAQVRVVIEDNGTGLEPGFDSRHGAGLGLRIVRTLIEKDLRGTFYLGNSESGQAAADSDTAHGYLGGTRAEFSFPLTGVHL